jgi:hypothetical protein
VGREFPKGIRGAFTLFGPKLEKVLVIVGNSREDSQGDCKDETGGTLSAE